MLNEVPCVYKIDKHDSGDCPCQCMTNTSVSHIRSSFRPRSDQGTVGSVGTDELGLHVLEIETLENGR